MEQCVICARAMIAGSLTFSSETRGDGESWEHFATLAEFLLCDEDYARISGLANASVQGFNEASVVLGMPLIEGGLALGTNHCDCCQSRVGDSAISMEILPEGSRARGTRRAGSMRRMRLCAACHGWWLSLIRDPSFMNGTASRVGEGHLGGWRSVPHGDAVFAHLGRRDEMILGMTMEADGRRARRIANATRLQDHEFGFVRAGRVDRATRFMLSLPGEVRGRFAVVAQADQLQDAAGALKHGAREILASPLSPQQIVGAGVRSFGLVSPGRDPRTGLMRLGPPLNLYGLSHSEVKVFPRNSIDPLEVVLLVRKFVRGWDEIGIDNGGNIVLRVYAERKDLAPILGRLRFAMGTVANFDRPGLMVVRAS
ncbi:MAG: hypothetical protein AB7N24_22205 [Dehalococcoidia bacterium]